MNTSQSAFYWDQASISFGGIVVGRAEGISFEVIGNWKPYMVPGSYTPAAIYDYGSWVTGTIRKAFIDANIFTLFYQQFIESGGTTPYFQITMTGQPKVTGQTIPTTTIMNAKFDWAFSLDLEDYAKENIKFIAKTISVGTTGGSTSPNIINPTRVQGGQI